MIELPPTLIPFRPPTFLKNGHAQTIYAHFLPHPKIASPSETWTIPVSDGDSLLAEYWRGTESVVVVAFHGLSGCSGSGYMKRVVRLCEQFGWHCLLVNHRGCGPGETLAKLPYHAGRSGDLGAALAFSRERLPRLTHLAVGFSLSGNALALLLTQDLPKPDAAMVVNAPLDLESTSLRLSRGFSQVYDRHFAFLLRANLRSRHRRGLVEDPQLPLGVSLRNLDALYTAKQGGFGTRDNYYAQSSSHPRLAKIDRPTTFLSAWDDPIVDGNLYTKIPDKPEIEVHLEKYGGHMGFIQDGLTPLGSRHWLDYAIAHFLKRSLDQIHNN